MKCQWPHLVDWSRGFFFVATLQFEFEPSIPPDVGAKSQPASEKPV